MPRVGFRSVCRHLHGDCSRDHRRPVGAGVHRALHSRNAAWMAIGQSLVRASPLCGMDGWRIDRLRAYLPRSLVRPKPRIGVALRLRPRMGRHERHHVDLRSPGRAACGSAALGKGRGAHAYSSPGDRSRRVRFSLQEPRRTGRSGESILPRLFHGRFHLAHRVDGGADEVRHATDQSVPRRPNHSGTTGRIFWFQPLSRRKDPQD